MSFTRPCWMGLLACLAFLGLFLSVVTVFAEETLDDRDPHIQYQSAWWNQTTYGAYLNTTKFTNMTGDTATVSFTGTQIAVYGVIEPPTASPPPVIRATFIVDGAQTTARNFTFSYTSADTQVQFNVSLYVSSVLTDGSHNLTITNQGNCFWIDFCVIGTMPTGIPSVSSEGSTPSSTTAMSSAASSITQASSSSPSGTSSEDGLPQSTPPLSPTTAIHPSDASSLILPPTSTSPGIVADAAQHPSRKLSRSQLAGIIVGSIAALLVFVGIFIYRRRQPKVQWMQTPVAPDYPSPASVTTFGSLASSSHSINRSEEGNSRRSTRTQVDEESENLFANAGSPKEDSGLSSSPHSPNSGHDAHLDMLSKLLATNTRFSSNRSTKSFRSMKSSAETYNDMDSDVGLALASPEDFDE
ncbi:hypothetical protein NM688_g6084 [Phlebia brevispora]|uniref:Uncharacterized protein n=1 Tax=Phlebia brevispora TaxID=194682 RepID=A0ACC1SK88_9APHY|nr:hypothetical protein NM688_g6084 [Phlebia brevispora]